MSLQRRSFLRLLALGVVGHELDVDRLLWMPGQKTIFLPTNPTIPMSQLVATEIERIAPTIHELFERDSVFYRQLEKKLDQFSTMDMKMPSVIKNNG